MKANCWSCSFRGEVPGSAHSSCHHPLIAKVTSGDELPMLKLFGPATAESTYIALETIARAREGIMEPAQ